LPRIELREVGAVLNADVTRARLTLRWKPQCSEEPIPKRKEQPEIHVTFTVPIHVVQSVYGPDSEKLLRRPKRIIDVRMLHDELQRDGEAKHYGHRNRHADQNERERADHDVKRLMQRVADEAIEMCY
jgi:hypothetical protein